MTTHLSARPLTASVRTVYARSVRLLGCVTVLLALAACTTIEKVEGAQLLDGRLALTVSRGWNKLPQASGDPFVTWTQEGVTIDQMRFWPGIEAGKELAVAPRATDTQRPPRPATFQASMAPDELVQQFEAVFSNAGFSVNVKRVGPGQFASSNGIQFEFELVNQTTHVQLNLLGWAAVRDQRLYAATFCAPRLAFFDRIKPLAESVIQTAQLRK